MPTFSAETDPLNYIALILKFSNVPFEEKTLKSCLEQNKEHVPKLCGAVLRLSQKNLLDEGSFKELMNNPSKAKDYASKTIEEAQSSRGPRV